MAKGERTTAAEVISELSQLDQELEGKRIRLIFSGRVLNPSDVISLIVPIGAVVQSSISRQSENEQSEEGTRSLHDDDDEEARRELFPNPMRRREAVSERNSQVDFLIGYVTNVTTYAY